METEIKFLICSLESAEIVSDERHLKMGESGYFSILRKLLIMPNDDRNKKFAKVAILDFERKFNTVLKMG